VEKLNSDQLMSALNWRYAVKKYDATKKISAQDWSTLEEVLRLSPSSFGLQPWKFLVVQSPDLRKKLTPATWGQPQVETCSHFVVLTTLKKIDEAYVQSYIDDIAFTRGIKASELDGFKKSMMGAVVNGPISQHLQTWSQKQVYIAMGNIMNAAALLHIDTTPMEGLEPAKYDDILGLTNTPYATVAAVACGYRSPDDQLQFAKKVRFPKAKVIQTL
jgi:nitroreductase